MFTHCAGDTQGKQLLKQSIKYFGLKINMAADFDWVVTNLSGYINLPTALVSGALGLWFFHWLLTRTWNLPPGPRGLPIVGAIYVLCKEMHELGFKWRYEYGDVVSFYAGNVLTVILNSHKVLREAFVKRVDEFNDRPDLAVHRLINYKDDMLFGPFDKNFKFNKKIATTGYRNHGFSSQTFVDKVESEIEHLIQIIKQKSGKPFDPAEVVMDAVTVLMTFVLYSGDLSQDDPRTKKMVDMLKGINALEMEDYLFHIELLPEWASKIIFKNVLKKAETTINEARQVLKREFEKHKATLDPDNLRDVMDHYVINRSMDDPRVLSTMLLFLPDATETTTGLITWPILFMLYNPDIQKRVHEELDEVVGKSGKPGMQHKGQLVYLQAVFYESLRLGNTTPMTVPHSAIRDTTLNGYNIPKHAVILGNMYAAHQDPEVFPDPKEFKPERFIDEDGKLHKTENVISFGIGRRACVGETLVKAECFMFLANMFHEFEFCFSPDHPKPTFDPITFFGLFKLPKPFHVVVKERE